MTDLPDTEREEMDVPDTTKRMYDDPATVEHEELANSPSFEMEVEQGDEEVGIDLAQHAPDDHPLVIEFGKQDLLQEKQQFADFVEDEIYSSAPVETFLREYFQNGETACVRAAKRLVRLMEGDDALTYSASENHAALTRERRIWLTYEPRYYVEKAKQYGYHASLTVDLDLDAEEITISDNGIGMTTQAAKNEWLEVQGSASKRDAGTGGMFGVGSESAFAVMPEGEAITGTTRTRIAEAPEHDRRGFRFAAYKNALSPLGGEVPDDFRGTRFEVPLAERHRRLSHRDDPTYHWGFVQNIVEKYARTLAVPVLYTEHLNGEQIENEDYGGVGFEDLYEDAITIHRPGEFSLALGEDLPDVADTRLVSMPIDRGSASFTTMQDIHLVVWDEQGRIIAGPHRGFYYGRKTGKVYETQAKTEVVSGSLHEDDVPLPEPPASRDNFRENKQYDRFFEYANALAQEREGEQVLSLLHALLSTPVEQHPDVLRMGGVEQWNLLEQYFKKQNVSYKGRLRSLDEFINDVRNLPGVDFSLLPGDPSKDSGFIGTQNEARVRMESISTLFKTLNVPKNGAATTAMRKKKNRKSERIGWLLAQMPPENVYITKTTGKRSDARHEVIHNTFDNATLAKVDSYRKWAELFPQFNRHTEIPFRKGMLTAKNVDESIAWDIPDAVHEDWRKDKDDNSKSTSNGVTRTKPEDVDEQYVSYRYDASSQDTDSKTTVKKLAAELEDGGRLDDIGGYGEDPLIMFDRSPKTENVTDHTRMQRDGVLVSLTKEQWDVLERYENAVPYDEFEGWQAAANATIVHPGKHDHPKAKKVTAAQLDAEYFNADIPEQPTLVLPTTTDDADKAAWHVAFGLSDPWLSEDYHERISQRMHDRICDTFDVDDISEIRLIRDDMWDSRHDHHIRHAKNISFSGTGTNTGSSITFDLDEMRENAETHRWPDDSDAYRLKDGAIDHSAGRFHDDYRKDDRFEAIMLGLHDSHIDPGELDFNELRELVESVDETILSPSHAARTDAPTPRDVDSMDTRPAILPATDSNNPANADD